jgi:predicted nucleic acid-binding protein
MAERKIIPDTSVLVHQISGTPPDEIKERLLNVRPLTYMSSVVVHELLRGARDDKGLKLVESLIKPFEKARRIITPSYTLWKSSAKVLSEIVRENHGYRNRISSLENDVLIALSSRAIGAIVLTSNKEDFELIRKFRNFRLETF